MKQEGPGNEEARVKGRKEDWGRGERRAEWRAAVSTDGCYMALALMLFSVNSKFVLHSL